MSMNIALWCIIFWLLLDFVSRVFYSLWGIFLPIWNSKPIDLRTTFGEWAVVTGSTDGIGKAYSKELAARGVNLILISRKLEKLEKTKDEILEMNPKIQVKIIVADFSEGKEVFKKIEPQLKDIPIGILVNNVGTHYEYPMYLGEVPEETLWDIINVNVGAATMMTRLLIGQMKERRKGAIVNISSGTELQPVPLITVYAATKAYVNSFSEALKWEYSGSGLTIQQLIPFFVKTNMIAFSHRLRVTSLFVPDATTYARNAIDTLGKVDTSAGYWTHGVQLFFTLLSPVWIRTLIGQFITQTLRNDYLKEKSS